MTARYSIAHHFAPATAALLGAQPNVGEVRAIDTAARWAVPTDVDVLFALHAAGAPSDHHQPAPPGWPGKVRFVQLASSGTDGYPDWLFDGPQVATAAGTGAVPISEYVLAAMLGHAKRLPAMFVTDGVPWPAQETLLAQPLGALDGRTLGLVGVGHIGARVAKLAAAFGMTVLAARRSDAASPSPDIALVPFDTLLARADHLVIAAPLTPATAGLIGAQALAKVKRGVHIVNIARGGIINSDALAAALADGRVGGATLDVTDPEPLPAGHPLWRAPNLRVTPHIAWSSADTPRRIFQLFATNLAKLAAGETPINLLALGAR